MFLITGWIYIYIGLIIIIAIARLINSNESGEKPHYVENIVRDYEYKKFQKQKAKERQEFYTQQRLKEMYSEKPKYYYKEQSYHSPTPKSSNKEMPHEETKTFEEEIVISPTFDGVTIEDLKKDLTPDDADVISAEGLEEHIKNAQERDTIEQALASME
ncbi:MAG: hypothetical protein IKW90_02440 [Lachnospiraceae bacterium]|nr:hypothetical protein [Lachnospiraceae bacterium]